MEHMKNEEYHWIDKSDTYFPTEYLEFSFKLAQAGQIQKAIEEVRRQISIYPTCHGMNYWLGILLYNFGDYLEACIAFKKELEITPRFRDAAWELGSACSKLGLITETIEAYHKALDIDPCCIQALYGLGNANLRSEHYLEALEYYKDALFLLPELDQSDPSSSNERSKSFAAVIHLNLGIACLLIGNHEKAQESFSMCQNIKPFGQSYELADYHLKLLSHLSDKQDTITWEMIELPLEDI